jgi:hypothetical protein
MKLQIDNNLRKIDQKSLIKFSDQCEIYTVNRIIKHLNDFFCSDKCCFVSHPTF